MAESIIIHFSTENKDEVVNALQQQFIPVGQDEFRFPEDDYLVIVTPYEDFDKEYEENEKEEIIEKIGSTPQFSYDFEIRRTKSDEACDLLERFIRTNFKNINYLVDDMFNLLSKEEVNQSNTFLDVYRYKKEKV